MIGLGWLEILILLFLGGMFLAAGVAVVVILFVAANRQRSDIPAPVRQPPPRQWVAAPPNDVAAGEDAADNRQTIIARLTQRFCPQCKSHLAADAPEGLCPACLMAGGLASEVNGHEHADANGLAVTTPPSGSQPPATGEWANLAHHFPQLEVLEVLGRGGMGTVYKARQKNLDRIVALKVIPPVAAQDPAFAERFQREARALARMNHPNVVTVYDFGQMGDIYYLLMEYVDGVNLRHTLKAGRLAPCEALAIVPQVCDALQYAHDQGVVHRDIKPENVLLDRSGRVKIADFGLAKLLGKGPDDFTLTRTQQVMGTPRYMAPEQIEKPLTVDHRADIYSLGVVIYEMLTGELPLGRFEPPSHKVQVDVRIDQVVLRALEKEPDRRYQRASQVKTELASASSWQGAGRREEILGAVPAVEAPSWHTPAPAAKSISSSEQLQPGGVPLAHVLAVAFGMVLGVLMMGAGIAVFIYGLIYSMVSAANAGAVWGFFGAAFGCIAGGFGSTAGSYNTYRQMAGAEDLLRSPRTTWLDWVMRGYLVLGLLMIAASFIDFPDGNPNPFASYLGLLILGSVASFQASLFILWRLFARTDSPAEERLPTLAQRNTPAQRQPPADPPFLRAVLLPVLVLTGLLAVVWIDISYTKPHYGLDQGRVTGAMMLAEQWQNAVPLLGLALVPLALAVLGGWRYWGPRRTLADGRQHVPYPFAARGWLWGVAALAGLSLFLPWFRLHVAPGTEAHLRILDKEHLNEPTSVRPQVLGPAGLKAVGGMPDGIRYAHRGIETPPAALAGILLVVMLVILSLAAEPGAAWRGVFLACCGGVALVLILRLLHDALAQPTWLVIDSVTEKNLREFAYNMHGSPRRGPLDVWEAALTKCFTPRPAIGMFLALAASGLTIFLAIAELCWGPVPLADAVPAPKHRVPLVEVDPRREAIRRRVAAPALGLMIAGIISLLPEVLGLLILPVAILVPSAHRIEQRLEPQFEHSVPTPSRENAPVPYPTPAAVLPTLVVHRAAGSALLGGHIDSPLLAAPLLLAQTDPMMDMMPIWAVLLGLLYLLNLALSITMIVAGWRMRKLKSYGLAMVGSSLALFPCTFAWIVALPMGIWSLAILMQPEVREAFES